MRSAPLKVMLTFVYGLWSCSPSWAAGTSEIPHLTGLLLSSPENKAVASALLQASRSSLIQSQKNSSELMAAAKALQLHKISLVFSACLKGSGAREQSLAKRILTVSQNSQLERDPCEYFNSAASIQKIGSLNEQLKKQSINELTSEVVAQSQFNIAKTTFYWSRAIRSGKAEISANALCKTVTCSDQEKRIFERAEASAKKDLLKSSFDQDPVTVASQLTQDKKNNHPDSPNNLLLFTETLKNKKSISGSDVLNAQAEIAELMSRQLSATRNLNLEDLVKTNPAAIGQVLMEHPEWAPLVCQSIQKVAKNESSREKWDQIYFWGGLVVGGTLLALGVSSAAGIWVLSETAITGVVVAGAALAVSDTLYYGQRSAGAFEEARDFRASFISKNGDSQSQAESENQVSVAYDNLIGTAMGAGSLIPFGRVWQFMSRSAKASRAGGLSKAGSITNSQKEVVLQNMEGLLKEIRQSPEAERALIQAKKMVSEQDFGSFMGQLSQLPPELRAEVLAKLKAHPEKASRAIEKGARSELEVCQ